MADFTPDLKRLLREAGCRFQTIIHDCVSEGILLENAIATAQNVLL